MDDTLLRYLIDSSRGGVTFSDLLKKVLSHGIIRRVHVHMYNESIVLHTSFTEFLHNAT